jgi:hypothetical protein
MFPPCHLYGRLCDNSVRGAGSLENRHAIRHLIYGWQTGVPARLMTALFDGLGASQKSSLPRGLKSGNWNLAKPLAVQWLTQNPMGLWCRLFNWTRYWKKGRPPA